MSEYGKEIYARREEAVERCFVEAKQLHKHRHARIRGLRKAQEQNPLCAWAANMKKIVLASSYPREAVLVLIWRSFAASCILLDIFTYIQPGQKQNLQRV